MKQLAAAFALLLIPAGCTSYKLQPSPLQAPTEASVIAVLTAQQDAWNRGDIDAFMDGYYQSDDLRFASGGTVTTGWGATRARYHQRYSDRAAMGQLMFSDLNVAHVGYDIAVVHGAWALQRTNDRPAGLFTLILRPINGEWKVVSDTTTSAG